MTLQVAQPGCLYVVATPIGNLQDCSQRAAQILGSVHIIACEDTRSARKLLDHLQLPAVTFVQYRDDNEQFAADKLLQCLKNGQSVALMCDAGTPTVSDPGFRLVRLCHKDGIRVLPIPGPSAVLTALSVSGLPSDQFLFAGFLPPKSAARIRFFESHADAPYTLILYESCHRILACLENIIQTLGQDRVIAVAREMTKHFESYHVGTVASVYAAVQSQSCKGEFVVLIAKNNFTL